MQSSYSKVKPPKVRHSKKNTTYGYNEEVKYILRGPSRVFKMALDRALEKGKEPKQ